MLIVPGAKRFWEYTEGETARMPVTSDRPISHAGAAARGTVVEEDSEKEKEKTDVPKTSAKWQSPSG